MSIKDYIVTKFESAEAFFAQLWTTKLEPAAEDAVELGKAFFSAAITDVASILGSTGLKIITDAVTAAETTGGTGEQKLAAAQAKIAADLTEAEIDAPAHIINAAIEGAVAQMNASADAVAVEVPAAQEGAESPDKAPATDEQA